MKIKPVLFFAAATFLFPGCPLYAQYESDVIKTSSGDLEMFFIGHGTLMFKYNGKVVHIDPWTRVGDYNTLPDADLILVTHEHGDHFEMKAIDQLIKDDTEVVMPQKCQDQEKDFTATVMNNGDKRTFHGIGVEAIPAYNLVHKRDNGQPFHAKGDGNSYILTFGDTRVLIGGDTENTPEMKGLKQHIHVAFLPMNLPYTMTPEMVADAAKAFRPDILYPYHYGNTDPQELVNLLRGEQGIEVRVRDLR